MTLQNVRSTSSYILDIQGNHSKHRYDIKNRPDNRQLSKHFHESRNLNDDLNVTILQNNIKTAATRRYHEDKWICTLKTLAPHGLNTKIYDNGKEMYNFC